MSKNIEKLKGEIERLKLQLDTERHRSKELERSLSEQRQQNAAELEALQKVSRAERCKNNRALSVLELLTEYLKK